MPTTPTPTPEVTMFRFTWINSSRLHTETWDLSQNGDLFQGVPVAEFAEMFPYIIVEQVA